MKKLWMICIGIMAISTVACGQYYNKLYFVSWAVNHPLSNTDFLGKTSTRGGRLGYQEMINEKFAGGVDLTWATYDDYVPRQTYQSGNGAITTDYFKYVTTYGATFAFNYYFFTEKKLMPYAGLGMGAAYNSYRIYYNVFSSMEGAWGFLVRPQAGVWLRLGERTPWALHSSLQFDYSTARQQDFGYNKFTSMGFQLGLVYQDW